MCLRDFPNQDDALKVADRLIKKSCEDFGHEHEEDLDADMPLLSRFKYHHSHGKSSTWTQTQKKELTGDGVLKNAKALQESAQMMEAMGQPPKEESEEEPWEHNGKIVAHEWDLCHTAAIDLRLSLLHFFFSLVSRWTSHLSHTVVGDLLHCRRSPVCMVCLPWGGGMQGRHEEA